MRFALPRLDSRRNRLILATALALIACLVLWQTAHAQAGDPVSNALDWAMTKLIQLIMWIIDLVGSIVLWLVTLLIDAAKYNKFTTAAPVVTGWVLVRDTVNMFFIVVLLVISFSTIIGYKTGEFGVKQNLPKLLLYAVLINFSKTLVGVMIDFSQVIMLTFVNGFQAAAGGNFITALKLTKILQLSDDTLKKNAADKIQSQDLPNLLGASLLGLGMLVISASVILILTVYLIFRIVGLWILLILSPMAFFALALPGRLQKGLDTFTGKWWSRLSAMLVGGPVVAFFLWLSLATVQGADPKSGPFGDIYPTDATTPSTAVSISKAGEPAELSSFVVAIIMLLAGLEAAISSTQAISQEGWQRLKQAKGVATRLTARAAKAGVRGSVAFGMGSARFVDQRTGLSSAVGKSLTNVGERAATNGGLVGAMLAPTLSRAGAAVSGISGARSEQAKSETEKGMKGLSVAGKNSYLTSMLAGARASGNTEKENVYQQMLRKNEISKGGQSLMKNNFEEDWYKKAGVTSDTARPEQKKIAKAYAEGRTNREVADRMDSLEKSYKDHGDTEAADKINGDREKDPALFNNLKDMGGYMAGKNDFKDLLKGVNVKSLADSATAVGVAKTAGWINDDGSMMSQEDIEGGDDWKALAKNKQRASMMREQLQHFRGGGNETMKAHLAEMNGVDGAESSAGQRYRMEGGKPVNVGQEVSSSAGAAVTTAAYTAPQVSNFDELTQAITPTSKAALSSAYSPERQGAIASRFSAPIDDRRAELLSSNAAVVNGQGMSDPSAYASSISSMQTMDIPADVASGFDLGSGKYRDATGGSSAHALSYQRAFNDMGSGDANKSVAAMDFVSNSSSQALSSDNQMSEVVIQQLTDNMENLKKGMAHASKQHQEKLQTMLGTLQKQMDAADARLKSAGGSATSSKYDESLWKLRDAMKEKGGKAITSMAAKGAKKA